MKIKKWMWLAWGCFSVLSFLVLEGIALWNGNPDDTLTQTLRWTVPGWVFFTVIGAFGGWFIHHFLTTYLNNKGGR
jgi:hypothetical protein